MGFTGDPRTSSRSEPVTPPDLRAHLLAEPAASCVIRMTWRGGGHRPSQPSGNVTNAVRSVPRSHWPHPPPSPIQVKKESCSTIGLFSYPQGVEEIMSYSPFNTSPSTHVSIAYASSLSWEFESLYIYIYILIDFLFFEFIEICWYPLVCNREELNERHWLLVRKPSEAEKGGNEWMKEGLLPWSLLQMGYHVMHLLTDLLTEIEGPYKQASTPLSLPHSSSLTVTACCLPWLGSQLLVAMLYCHIFHPWMNGRPMWMDDIGMDGFMDGWMDGWLSWMWTIVDIRRYIHKWLINNTIITTIQDVIQFANILLKYSFQQYFFSFFVLNGIYLVLCPQAKTSLNQSSVYHKYMYM